MNHSSQDTARRKKKSHDTPGRRTIAPREPMAVIDIGSTSIRLIIAEVDISSGGLRIIESLQQSVGIGRDTFTKGLIEKATIEESVGALRHFLQVLREHGFSDNRRIRVVATTAVREAVNREAFRDRVNIACGWQVEILDLADIARLTYLGFRPFLDRKEFSPSSDQLIVEMGGGTTEVYYIGHTNRAFSQTFTIGTLRLRQAAESYELPLAQQQAILNQNIVRFVDRIAADLKDKKDFAVVALGGEMRFAAAELAPEWDGIAPVSLPVTGLKTYTDRIAEMPVEKIVKKRRIAFSDAETLTPALLFYTRLVRKLGKKHLIVASTSMRHGILMEMAGYGKGEERFRQIILGAAEELAARYHSDIAHVKHVARLAEALFDTLVEEHRLKAADRLLLSVAAMLHDVGLFVGPRNHHKHSMYLIRNSDVFGLNSHDIELVSLIARYHRRSPPRPTHAEYMALTFNDRIIVAKLSAILRVADALDHSHSGRIQEIRCTIQKGRLVLTTPGVEDISLEEISLQSKGSLFEDVYGLRPAIQAET